MKAILLAAAVSLAALSSPVRAEAPSLSGVWSLSAKVASVPWRLVCHFRAMGERLGGVCADPKDGGKVPLKVVQVDGDKVTFAHEGRFLLNTFDVTYSGVKDGDRITGRIAVFGHTGEFTAVREGD
jgi:hypothetical protein